MSIRYIETHYCEGCQTCRESIEGDKIIQYEHVLSTVDMTDTIKTREKKMLRSTINLLGQTRYCTWTDDALNDLMEDVYSDVGLVQLF